MFWNRVVWIRLGWVWVAQDLRPAYGKVGVPRPQGYHLSERC
jgi:hypothetical protein